MYEVVIWCFCCMSVCSIFTMATLTVYSVVPELKNLQGCLLRRYLASYFGYCVMTLLAFAFNYELFFQPVAVENIYGTMMIYFWTASAFWLNVMSFDIWRTFRNIQSAIDANSNVREKAKLLPYSIYAWGIPVISSIFNGYLNLTSGNPNYPKDETRFYLRLADTLILILIATCNTCLYVSTALKIKKLNKETAHIVGGINKHHRENKQWFNLYVKLFTLMGVRTLVWIAMPIVLWNGYHIFVGGLEVVDSICVFLIFVWKDDVRRSFQKQFFETVSNLRSTLFRRHSICTVENGGGN